MFYGIYGICSVKMKARPMSSIHVCVCLGKLITTIVRLFTLKIDDGLECMTRKACTNIVFTVGGELYCSAIIYTK